MPTADFARLVSLACHDLRTPLATVQGFARTLTRLETVDEPAARYLGMIDAAATQLAGLLDELSLAARIEAGRYDPPPLEANLLELARRAAARVEDVAVSVEGEGASVVVDPAAIERALAALARCAGRHGGVSEIGLLVAGTSVAVSPVVPEAAPVVLGDDLKDLGAAVARRAIEALGGALRLEGATLHVSLPAA